MNKVHPAAGHSLKICVMLLLAITLTNDDANAQFARNWLSVGSLHNWYSAGGSEIEHGFVARQQFGLHWPGIYRLRDAQAAKGLWIGAENVTAPDGSTYPYRVIHVGPRVRGVDEVFPLEFETIAKWQPTEVFVDGAITEGAQHGAVTQVDPSIPADRMIVSRFNTLLGLTVERRILAFSQEFHDNYHVIEYVLTNTGMTGPDETVSLPNQTLENVMMFLQWRWSVAAESRYVIDNSTGWGMQTMIDRRGDGVMPDPADENFRAQFAWHGHFPRFTAYSPVGGPILPEALPAAQIAVDDTLGRLGASQFVGQLTLHADRSADDASDDWGQPYTMNYFDSDLGLLSNNSAFDREKMRTEYELMTQGRLAPRHAYMVEPTGDTGFVNPSASPSSGTQGGYSAGSGYGPYTLGPGESVRIVTVEAAAGLSRDANEKIGRQYLLAGSNRDQAQLTYEVDGQTHSMTKNEWVLTSRDSLFQTFRRAIANYESDWNIPSPPAPPALFEVFSRGGGIELSWLPQSDEPLPDNWEIYRSRSRVDSSYTLVATLPGGDTSYLDEEPTRGIDYYYYLLAVNQGGNDGTGLTPSDQPMRSSRYYTQTYQPARLLRAPGESMEDIRVVPNPFNIRSTRELRWPDQDDRLGFLNVPGQATIKIYSELGELIDTIVHTNGSGDAYWNHTTSAGQVVVSGVYIAVITDDETGEQAMRKFVIIR